MSTDPGLISELEKLTYNLCTSFAELVLRLGNEDAHEALLRVRAHLESRLQQTDSINHLPPVGAPPDGNE